MSGPGQGQCIDMAKCSLYVGTNYPCSMPGLMTCHTDQSILLSPSCCWNIWQFLYLGEPNLWIAYSEPFLKFHVITKILTTNEYKSFHFWVTHGSVCVSGDWPVAGQGRVWPMGTSGQCPPNIGLTSMHYKSSSSRPPTDRYTHPHTWLDPDRNNIISKL